MKTSKMLWCDGLISSQHPYRVELDHRLVVAESLVGFACGVGDYRLKQLLPDHRCLARHDSSSGAHPYDSSRLDTESDGTGDR